MAEQWKLTKMQNKIEVEKYYSSSIVGLFKLLRFKGVFDHKKK
jgi:hypothetical protein